MEIQNLISEKKEFNIGIVSCPRAGKTSIINGLLGFPLLPVTALATLHPLFKVKYAEMIQIELCLYNKTKMIPYDELSSDLFEDLLSFYCICFTVIGLENIRYFMNKPLKSGTKTISPDGLKMNPNDPRHTATLLLAVLSADVEQNENEKNLEADIKELLRLRRKIFHSIGLSEEDKVSTVTVYWNAPFLKNGLSIVDISEIGIDEIAVLEAVAGVQALMCVLEPIRIHIGSGMLEPMMNIFAKKSAYVDDGIIIGVVNKMDQIALGGSGDEILLETEKFFNERGMPAKKILGLRARDGEYSYIENGVTSIEKTAFACNRRDYNDKEEGQNELPRYQAILKRCYENKSGIPELRKLLSDLVNTR